MYPRLRGFDIWLLFFRPYVEISGSENRTIKVMLAGSPKSSELRKTLIVRFSIQSGFLARFCFSESLFCFSESLFPFILVLIKK